MSDPCAAHPSFHPYCPACITARKEASKPEDKPVEPAPGPIVAVEVKDEPEGE